MPKEHRFKCESRRQIQALGEFPADQRDLVVPAQHLPNNWGDSFSFSPLAPEGIEFRVLTGFLLGPPMVPFKVWICHLPKWRQRAAVPLLIAERLVFLFWHESQMHDRTIARCVIAS
jgi:hypothetical protein